MDAVEMLNGGKKLPLAEILRNKLSTVEFNYV
jgi:hypothetical protein